MVRYYNGNLMKIKIPPGLPGVGGIETHN